MVHIRCSVLSCTALCCPLGNAMILANGRILASAKLFATAKDDILSLFRWLSQL